MATDFAVFRIFLDVNLQENICTQDVRARLYKNIVTRCQIVAPEACILQEPERIMCIKTTTKIHHSFHL